MKARRRQLRLIPRRGFLGFLPVSFRSTPPEKKRRGDAASAADMAVKAPPKVLQSKASNQYWLATKYGGFMVPDGYDPYANTTALAQSLPPIPPSLRR